MKLPDFSHLVKPLQMSKSKALHIVSNFSGLKYHKMEITLELQHATLRRKFQKPTKVEGLTTKTPLQP